MANDAQKPDPAKHDALTVFDVAWSEFQPTCEILDCPAEVGLGMWQCATHTTLEELL